MKRIFKILLLMVLLICLTACGSDKSGNQVETATLSPDKAVAIHAGDINVYLDEAKYYAYTAQATYETYFITEGKEIDWDSEMQDAISWQQGVKSTVLDDICRRECMYGLAEEYNVSLTEEQQEEINAKVDAYYSRSNEKLLSKIGVGRERLKFIFEKEEIAKRVEEIMATVDENLPDETYEKWKSGNTVTAEEQWKSITFNEPIFTLEDIQ